MKHSEMICNRTNPSSFFQVIIFFVESYITGKISMIAYKNSLFVGGKL